MRGVLHLRCAVYVLLTFSCLCVLSKLVAFMMYPFALSTHDALPYCTLRKSKLGGFAHCLECSGAFRVRSRKLAIIPVAFRRHATGAFVKPFICTEHLLFALGAHALCGRPVVFSQRTLLLQQASPHLKVMPLCTSCGVPRLSSLRGMTSLLCRMAPHHHP